MPITEILVVEAYFDSMCVCFLKKQRQSSPTETLLKFLSPEEILRVR